MELDKDADASLEHSCLTAVVENEANCDEEFCNDVEMNFNLMDQTDLKTEITIEPERIEEDTSYLQPTELQVMQIEVCSSFDAVSKVCSENIISLLEDQHVEQYEEIGIVTNIDKTEEDFFLSDVMSDHNYTSQVLIAETKPNNNSLDLRQLLLDQILRKSENGELTIPANITNFVDKIISQIDLFKVDSLNQRQPQLQSKEYEGFTENVNKLSPQYNGSRTDVQEFVSMEENKVADNELSIPNVQEISTYLDDLGNQSPLTLPEDCSEPMEFLPSSELFDISNPHVEDLERKNTLRKTMEFAKSLYNDCNSFASAKICINNKFKSYIKEQIRKLKDITCNDDFMEKCIQTESSLSAKKRKRLNYRAQQKLLESSHSSSSGMESSDESSDSSQKSHSDVNSLKSQSSKSTVFERLANSQASEDPAKSIVNDNDDGIDLSNYIQSDIFGREYQKSSFGASESDKENRRKEKCVSSGEDTDKEIERLTNLSCLSKRQNQPSAKLTEGDKPKVKLSNQKNEHNLFDFCESILENHDSSDKSICQSEDEIVTEKEYLSRYNEEIKKQLLNDTSSDSSDFDCDNDLTNNLTDENDEDDKPLLVDKFLESFVVNESDNEDEETNEETSEVKAAETPKIKIERDLIKPEAGGLSTPESSDCELLNEFLSHKKKTNNKSLEKMILEADKRNNGNEEIVLSSESDYSDVEAIDVDRAEEKSRIIKPMLRPDQLANETRKAQKIETERIRKLEKQQAALQKAKKNNTGKINSTDLILDYIESTKTFIKVDPDIVKDLKSHQVDGLKFMYESCYAGCDFSKKTSGSGCILAHCMGLGKTLQLIALIYTVVSYKELNTSKVMVLCPKSTVMNWAEELQRWLGPLKKKKHLKVFAFPESSDIKEKLNVLEEWASSTTDKPGCLLLGYEAFRTLVFYHSYKNRGKCLNPKQLEDIKQKVDKFLLKPGADLVVCDEGHIIKNSKSAISLAVAKIITPKRIILTGTPIQNNLKEYYSMVNFIKPLYLGTEKEFANLYANPIKNGQHKDSSKKDIKVMKQRSFVLHKKLSKFVQRKEAELLKTFLPPKFEYVLFIPMTSVQKILYEFILDAIQKRGDNRGKGLITDYTCLRKIWTHPKVLQDAWQNAITQKSKNDTRRNQAPHSDDDQPDDIYDSQTGVMSVTNDWWRHLLEQQDLETITPSNKLRAMFEILRMCEEKGEKCLIFSAFVAVLNVVEYFFKKISDRDPEVLQQTGSISNKKISNVWILGQDYYRLDGKTPKTIRHEMIKRFNSATNKRARVFLISSKAGGQGINLTGANRVIILDTSWNPSNDQQNIFRIFRLGQKRNCYIYRLLAMGTMEEKVYTRSVTKQAMSFRVVDEQQIDRHYNMAELGELYKLTIPKSSERPMPVVPKDNILGTLLLNYPDIVYKYHEHDSLLENKVEQELSEQEKADAWAAYERELHINLEQQEAATSEKLSNNFLASKMNNFMGSIPGLDMQALLNCGIFNPQAASAYSYSTNPQYLEALYRSLAMGYNDVNSPLTDSVFNSSLYNVPSSLSMMSSMHANVPTSSTNPLSALNDFNMFGIGAQKNYVPSNPASTAIPPLQSPLLSNFASSSLASSTLSNANLMPPFEQYKQRFANAFPNYLNYAANNYATTSGITGPISSAAVVGGSVGLGPTNLYSTQKSANSTPDLSSPADSLRMQAKDAEKVLADKSKAMLKDDALQKGTSVLQNLTTSHVPPPPAHSNILQRSTEPQIPKTVPPPTTTKPPMAHMAITHTPTSAQTIASAVNNTKNRNPKSDYNGNAPPAKATFNGSNVANMGIVYPNYKGGTSSEMQIIPTTSPPGTSSISKQLNEMSPSISLTAVRKSNTPNSVTSLPSQVQQSKQKQNVNLTNNNKNTSNLVGGYNKAIKSASLQMQVKPLSVAPVASHSMPSAGAAGAAKLATTSALNRGETLLRKADVNVKKTNLISMKIPQQQQQKALAGPAVSKSSLISESMACGAGSLSAHSKDNVTKLVPVKTTVKHGIKLTHGATVGELPNVRSSYIQTNRQPQLTAAAAIQGEKNKNVSNYTVQKQVPSASPNIHAQPKPSGTAQYSEKGTTLITRETIQKSVKAPVKRKLDDPKNYTEAKRINI